MTFRFLRRLVQARGPGLARPDERDWLAQYNTYDARNLFSHLLRRAQEGEEIVIARAGEPVAKLIAYGGDEPRRKGILRVQLVVRDSPPPTTAAPE